MTTVVGTALADAYGHMDGYGHMNGWEDSGWMWVWGTIMMLAFIALVGLGIWALVRSQSRAHAPDRDTSLDWTASARTILAERFARGEISSEEYREKLDHLQA
jgi:putative membrane protein